MSDRLPFHAQLSSIMETMARTTLMEVYKLVDEDSAQMQLELSRLLMANSELAEKVNSLECELTIVRSDSPKSSKSYRSVGVQTARCRDADVSPPPAIDGIFGKDWSVNLWKDRDPYSVERYPHHPSLCPEKSTETLPDNITVTEIKEEDILEDASSSCHQEMLQQHGEHEVSLGEEQEHLSVNYSMDGSTCSLSFDQIGESMVSAGRIDEAPLHLVSIDEAEEDFSAHIIPIEEEDEDDDVQFVEESQHEASMNFSFSHQPQQMIQTDNSENDSYVDEDWHSGIDIYKFPASSYSKSRKFTCQICSRSFFHKGTLTHHMKSHKTNFCNICKQHFPQRTKHNSHNCVPPLSSQRFSKACQLCGKVFANPSALRIHYVVHTGEKPYTCNMCGKGFTQKGNLKCHLRIHTGERPFRCNKCGKTFTQKVNLNHHMMAHQNREVVGTKPASKKLEKADKDRSSQ